MEFGVIACEPYTEDNINKLDRIQKQTNRFIIGD